MKPKVYLFIMGFIVMILGLLPLLKFIPAIDNIIKSLPAAGSTAYQVLIALIGFIAILISLQKKPMIITQR